MPPDGGTHCQGLVSTGSAVSAALYFETSGATHTSPTVSVSVQLTDGSAGSSSEARASTESYKARRGRVNLFLFVGD